MTQVYHVTSERTMIFLPHALQRKWLQNRCHYVFAHPRLQQMPLSSCPISNYYESSSATLPLIAVILGSTSRHIQPRVIKNMPLFLYLLPSLIRSLDCGYRYEVVLGYDIGDAFYDTKDVSVTGYSCTLLFGLIGSL